MCWLDCLRTYVVLALRFPQCSGQQKFQIIIESILIFTALILIGIKFPYGQISKRTIIVIFSLIAQWKTTPEWKREHLFRRDFGKLSKS